MAGEAIVLLGASDRYAQALHTLDSWTQALRTTPFALLDATLALEPDGNWLRQALPRVAQRLRDAVETFASDTTEALDGVQQLDEALALAGGQALALTRGPAPD